MTKTQQAHANTAWQDEKPWTDPLDEPDPLDEDWPVQSLNEVAT